MKENKIWKSALMLALVVLFSACDLDIEEDDSVFTSDDQGTFSGVSDVQASVDGLFGSINGIGDQANFFALVEVTTDEFLVPTRGTDWGDNGIWRTLHAHTWNSTHLYVLNTWNTFNQLIFRATEVIDERSTTGRTPELVAQARFVRAFSTWIIIDLYGQSPFRGVDDGPLVNPTVRTRMEAWQAAVDDLNAALPDLPANGPGAGNERGTQAAANMLLAKLYLNAHIYDGSGTASNENMQRVIDLVDAIEADGYALQEGYFEIFEESADSETIWWIPTGVGNRIWNGLHYNQTSADNGGGGWNGFSTLAEFYDLFEGDPSTNTVGSGQEERRGFVPTLENADATNIGIGYGFLIGQQVGATGFTDGAPDGFQNLQDRARQPLNFTKQFPGLNGNTESNGIRVIKYHPVNGGFTAHEIVFRWADAYLMRAEARLRQGADVTAEVNALRGLRQASPLGSVSEQDMIDERGRELYEEFWRRNDLIRFGQFTRAWEFKDEAAVGADFRNLFPIPVDALLSNPNLVQNEGY